MNIYNLIKEELDTILDENLYHGSPHDFEEFLTDYMGSGEGNQTFGWGLYFTELKDIAEQYAENLTKKDIKKMYDNDDMPIEAYDALYDVDFLGYDDEWGAANLFYSKSKDYIIDNYDINEDQYNKINDAFIKGKRKLYKIVLDKNNLNWLEWDKPVPDSIYETIGYKLKYNDKFLRELFDDSKEFEKTDGSFVKGNKPDGLLFYKRISQILGSDKDASLFLLKHGIDGIKYPAESIAKGKNSENARGFNYVIFDPSIIKIEKKIKY
jgi:hypothetical protein